MLFFSCYFIIMTFLACKVTFNHVLMIVIILNKLAMKIYDLAPEQKSEFRAVLVSTPGQFPVPSSPFIASAVCICLL